MDRHFSRPVQPHAARAFPRRRAAADLRHPGQPGPALRTEAAAQVAERRRREVPGQEPAVLHQQRQGTGPAPGRRRGQRRLQQALRRPLRRLRHAVPARGRGRLRRAAAALLRAAALQRRDPPALPAPLPPCAGRRVPGHQRAAVPVAQAAGRPRHAEPGRGLCRGRRRPEHLRLPRRQRRQYARLRA
ncbi:hypothetical protein D3C81_1276620 [compost metagenome]